MPQSFSARVALEERSYKVCKSNTAIIIKPRPGQFTWRNN